MAERLGYDPGDLDRIPSGAIESFAGVGHFFDLADLSEGETVLDLGSGSGMDVFVAALKVGKTGKVIGVDMTDEQLEKSRRLAAEGGFDNVEFHKSYVEHLPVEDDSVDAVISNGVINLVPDKGAAFREAARVLKPTGRLAIADIVTKEQLPEGVTCDASLWAACIGGAMQDDDYRESICDDGSRSAPCEINPNTTSSRIRPRERPRSTGCGPYQSWRSSHNHSQRESEVST